MHYVASICVILWKLNHAMSCVNRDRTKNIIAFNKLMEFVMILHS